MTPSTIYPPQPVTIGQQIRDRRIEAFRLPPSESGHRDPLDDRPPMSPAQLRAFCNQLARMGFSIDYLERRYGVRRSA